MAKCYCLRKCALTTLAVYVCVNFGKFLECCDSCTAPCSFKSFWLVFWISCRPLCTVPQCHPQSLSVPLSVFWQVFPVHASWVFGGQVSYVEVWQDWASLCQKESTTSRASGSVEESRVLEEVDTSSGFDLLVGICLRCFRPQIWRLPGSGVRLFEPLSRLSTPFRSTCWSWFGFRVGAFSNFLASSLANFFAQCARSHFGTT